MAQENLTIRVDEKGAIVASRNIDQVGKSAKGAGGGLKLLKNALGALAAAAAVKQLIDLADTFTVIQNKLKIVTTGTENLANVTDELFNIATRTRSSFEATADSYSKFALSAKESGRSQQELLQFTELVNKAVIIGGSSASEAAGGLRQLSQGIASGALRGDELISVLENLPFVADTIAKELGVTRGALRDMGKEGKITADIVLDAFKNQADFLNTEYDKTVITVGQSMTLLGNAALKLIGGFDKGSGATTALAAGISKLADNMLRLEAPINFLYDVGVSVFETMEPAVAAIVGQFGAWGVNAESLKETMEDLGFVFVALLRTSTQVLDGIISSFNILGKVIATAVFGGLQDAGHAWEGATRYWKELFRSFINDIIAKLNDGLTSLGIDPIAYMLPDKSKAETQAFDWGKGMGEAISSGYINPLTDAFDKVLALTSDKQLQAQLEALRPKAGGGAITTEQGQAAVDPQAEAYAAILGKTNQDLERQRVLLGLTNEEAEAKVAIWKVLDALQKEGVNSIQSGDEAALNQAITANQELERKKALTEDILGPQLAYNQAIMDLAELQAAGIITSTQAVEKTKELKDALDKVANDDTTSGLQNALVTPFDVATRAIDDFVTTGEFKMRDFTTAILQQFAKIAQAQLFSSIGGGLGLPGFATGGDFTVGGNGGTDSQVVAFKATPGEQVSVSTPGQQRQMQGGSVPSVAAPVVNVTIVNVTDPEEALEMMKSDEGGKVIVNQLSNNRTAAKQALS